MPKNKFSLSDAMMIAESHGNAFPKNILTVKFQCFRSAIKTINGICSFRSVKNHHSWCPYCSNRKLDISVTKELAVLKTEGVFPKLMLIIAHLFYGNAKIAINFASLFQML